MKVRDLIRMLHGDGWYLVRTRGSHRQFHHRTKLGTVTVAGKPSLEIPPGTLNMKYLVVIEKGRGSYGAFVPDLPGCVAVAKSSREVRKLIREAIAMHLDDMRERGMRIPKAAARIDVVEAKSLRRGKAA